MQEPPFIVGRPVTGEYFVNREEELRRLLALVGGVKKGASSNSANRVAADREDFGPRESRS